jgi:hypothetical protein
MTDTADSPAYRQEGTLPKAGQGPTPGPIPATCYRR